MTIFRAGHIHTPNKVSGDASPRFCLDAVEAARAGIIDALVTGP